MNQPTLRIRSFLSAACLACSLTSGAQTNTAASVKRFGFQAGVNMAAMDFNLGSPAPAVQEGVSWNAGFTFGFLLGIPLTGNLSLQPEYALTQRNGTDNSLGLSYTLNYFSMPVLLNYKISSVLSVIAGPQFELLISAKSRVNKEPSNITHDTEERSFGLTAGLEARIIKNIFLSTRFFHGLNHIGIGQRSDVKEFKYEVVNLTAGIRF